MGPVGPAGMVKANTLAVSGPEAVTAMGDPVEIVGVPKPAAVPAGPVGPVPPAGPVGPVGPAKAALAMVAFLIALAVVS